MKPAEILSEARALLDDAIQLRRRIHRHPEIGLTLPHTQAAVLDALPLCEATGLPFASEVDGAMHACGHDAHVAMLVGVARVLARRRAGARGRGPLPVPA